MKTFLAVVGALHLLAFFAGALGLIDYHVCISGPGNCGSHDEKETK